MRAFRGAKVFFRYCCAVVEISMRCCRAAAGYIGPKILDNYLQKNTNTHTHVCVVIVDDLGIKKESGPGT